YYYYYLISGNGFFGDKFFDPTVWTAALSKMAATFNGVSNVVGMSLRNELRGTKQNVNDWFKYMQQGAEAVHSANKNVLVIMSGLSFDTDLSFLMPRPVHLSFTGKLVFELHWYSFSDGNSWSTNNSNDNCGQVLNRIRNNGGFLLNQGFPLFLSEIGIDERGGNVNDDRYFGCLTGWAAKNDVDWSLWALTGTYYLRLGVVGLNEYYGVLDSDWISVRNSSFLQKIYLLQSTLQGPGPRTDAYNLVFHPLTGLCLVCSLKDTAMLTLVTDQKIGLPCLGRVVRESRWQTISASRMHLALTTSKNNSLCLDVDATNNILANPCKCLSKDSSCQPMSQWFKIINATRPLESSKLYKQLENLSPRSDML
ncbi:unnamed protein product, partial [Brassica napus]